MRGDLTHDLFHCLAATIACKCIGIARIDYQRPGAAEFRLLAAQLDFGRRAGALREDPGQIRPFR